MFKLEYAHETNFLTDIFLEFLIHSDDRLGYCVIDDVMYVFASLAVVICE